MDGGALGWGLKPNLHPNRIEHYAVGWGESTSSSREIYEGIGGEPSKIPDDPGGIGVRNPIDPTSRAGGGPIGQPYDTVCPDIHGGIHKAPGVVNGSPARSRRTGVQNQLLIERDVNPEGDMDVRRREGDRWITGRRFREI